MVKKMVLGNKKKIVEVLTIDKDFELLQHHLQNVYENIHHILILVDVNFDKMVELNKITTKWVDKISYFFLEEGLSPLDLSNLSKITDFLKQLDLGFEDIVCFSEISEIPDLINFNDVVEHLKFEPVILRMTDFTFNLKKHCKNRHLGSLCVYFSFLLTNPNKVRQINDNKKVFFWRSFYFVDNGFKFSFFQKKLNILDDFRKKGIEVSSADLEDIVSKNIHPKFFETEQKHYLSDYQENIDFNIDFLIEQDEISSSSNKILIILNLKQKKVETSKLGEYFRVLNFNFSRDYSLLEHSTLENVENINIFFPRTIPYEVNENHFFETEFVFKELKRKLNQSNFIANQNLNFTIFIDKLELEEKLEISWEKLKKSNLKEVLIKFFESDEHFQNLVTLNF